MAGRHRPGQPSRAACAGSVSGGGGAGGGVGRRHGAGAVEVWPVVDRAQSATVGAAAAPGGVGSKVTHPMRGNHASTHACASVSVTTYSPLLGRERSRQEAVGDTRGNAAHPKQQCHRPGELLAIAETVTEQEGQDRVGRRRRGERVAEAVGEVPDDPLRKRVRRLRVALERLRESERRCIRGRGDRCARL